MDEATFRAVPESVINDETLAKAEDVAKLHDTMEGREGDLTNIDEEIAELGRRLELVEGTAASPPEKRRRSKTSIGSRASAANSAGDADAWRPRLVRVRGFAEYGCPRAHTARKGQMEQIQATLWRSVPKHISERLAPMGGFALNHQVSSRAVEKDPGTVADMLDRWIQDHKFTILGKSIRSTIETHPRRRRAYSTWHGLQRCLQELRREGEGEACL